MKPINLDLNIYQGATYRQEFVWSQSNSVKVTEVILGEVTTIKTESHNLPTGTRVLLFGIQGTSDLNKQLYTIDVKDKMNMIVDVDSSGMSPYLGGGIVTLPNDLTDYQALMQIRTNKSDEDYLLELSTANNRIALGGQNGVIELHIAAADTATLPSGSHFYDLELSSSSGEVYRVIQGKVTVDQEVTR